MMSWTCVEKALRIKSAIPHPKIVGVIRECGGKMYMNQKEWEKARTDFFEGFKSFDEAGEPRRLQVRWIATSSERVDFSIILMTSIVPQVSRIDQYVE